MLHTRVRGRRDADTAPENRASRRGRLQLSGPMQRVLFLCTGNSCRSVMAEALLNALGNGRFHAESAGSQPAGVVHPGSLATLARHAIPAGSPRSKSWDEFAGQHFDYVITVCDNAAGEACPAFTGRAQRLHWSTPDPARATGSEQQIEAAFEEAFRMLRANIEALIA
jgi:arsenate reductase